jgi:hypothetical protein
VVGALVHADASQLMAWGATSLVGECDLVTVSSPAAWSRGLHPRDVALDHVLQNRAAPTAPKYTSTLY